MVGGAASALAIPSALDVDFRSTAWPSASGRSNYSPGNVTDNVVFPSGSALTTSSKAGIVANVPLSRVSAETSSAVPDGGTTLALLGIGLISLTVVRRGFAL
jgi:hypothetical protein